jgi:hypothetical protein
MGRMGPTIRPGNRVAARDAFGQENPRRAISGVSAGHDFPVVWICREDEWEAAQQEGREPDGVPWPAEDVHVREDVGSAVTAQ